MGVYTRYKRGPEGFRALVELLESTPKARRDRMVEVGMEEDPTFTERALEYILTFEDILKMDDMELAEVVTAAPPRMTAYAIQSLGPDVVQRAVRCAKPNVAAEIREYLDSPKVTAREIGGAQLKLVTVARSLERRGILKTKRIPLD